MTTKKSRSTLPPRTMGLINFPFPPAPKAYKCFVFSDAKDIGEVPSVRFTTPIVFILDGQLFTVTSWWKFLLATCDALHKWDQEMFLDAIKTTPIRPFYKEQIKTIDTPYLHQASGVCLDRTMDADGSLKGVWKLCKKCGVPMERIVIVYEVTPDYDEPMAMK